MLVGATTTLDTSTTTIPRYYYDSVAGVCTQFQYNINFDASVTNTNGNNFATLDHCTSYCIDSSCARRAWQ